MIVIIIKYIIDSFQLGLPTLEEAIRGEESINIILDFDRIASKAMEIVKERKASLTHQQLRKVKRIISNCNKMIIAALSETLGLDSAGRSYIEVNALVELASKNGVMSLEQESRIKDYKLQSQVALIDAL